MMNTENTTNEAMVNNQATDQTAVATQQPAPAAVDDQKKGFFTKAKETAKKVWNSKPAKVVKTAALVGGGFAAGLLVAGAGKKDDDSDQAVAEADYSEAPVDDTEA